MEKPGITIISRIVSLSSYIFWSYPSRCCGRDFFIADFTDSMRDFVDYYWLNRFIKKIRPKIP